MSTFEDKTLPRHASEALCGGFVLYGQSAGS
jgi:hypothetical protein